MARFTVRYLSVEDTTDASTVEEPSQAELRMTFFCEPPKSVGICTRYTTVTSGIRERCNGHTYAEVGWLARPQISKDMVPWKRVKIVVYQYL